MATRKADPYRRVERLDVILWGQTIGAVAPDPVLGCYVFAYTPAFRRQGVEPAPLQMPLAGGPDVYAFANLPEATYKRLPAMLADALPDDFGNALVERYMADKGIAADRITALDRLAYMGTRAMGALEFKPQRGPRNQATTAVDMRELVQEARNALAGSIGDDVQTNATLRSIIDVGTSAGGARAKAVIAWNAATGEIRSGHAAAPPGFDHYLLKFDGMGRDRELGASEDDGRIEYAYALMAGAAGITMSDCRLLEEHGRAHFMTRRFDREGAHTKHHMQTLCAMAHVDFKKKSTNAYSQLFMTIHALKLDRSAMVEAFRRMVFNVMARNCDDHSKNFSFLLRQGGNWELAPAYDLTFAHNPHGEWTSQHLMSVNGKYTDITRDDLLAEANRFGVGEGKRIVAQVRAAVQEWPSFAHAAGVSAAVRRHVAGQHELLS